MKLSKLLDVTRCSELIEVYTKNDVCGEVSIFKGLMWDFYIAPIARDRYHDYYKKEVDVIESYYDDDLDDSIITITIINN